MSWNETMEKALAQARDLHTQMLEAANKATEDMKPQLQATLQKARELQSVFNRHAADSSAAAADQAKTASKHLNDFIAMGSEAMRQSAEQTRATAQQMSEHAQKVVEATTAAMGKKPS
jgi:uncharacterized protein YukE